MKETNHDYAGALTGNYFSNDCNGSFDSWHKFKSIWAGFVPEQYDDTYNFLFRFDVKKVARTYELELCFMLQRKGIYSHIRVKNITQEELDTEVRQWLKGRKKYMDSLWEGLD